MEAELSISAADELLKLVPVDGSTISNRSLRELIKWELDQYQKARDELVRKGLIRLGPGRGGTVSRLQGVTVTVAAGVVAKAVVAAGPERKRERDLYPGFLKGLKKWATDQGWTDHFVEQIAHQGRRATGGNWTRPDFVIVGIQKYEYTPGVVRDLETFEVKPPSCAIDAVFETAAHSRFATKSRLAVQMDDSGPSEDDLARIESECQRFGLGLIIFRDPENPDAWDYRVEPTRHEPDPELLEQFVKTQVTDKEKLRKWLR